LHSLVVRRGGEVVAHRPLLAASDEVEVPLAGPGGWLDARCGVHPGEPAAQIFVVEHPFAVLSDPEGRFTLSGIPARRIALEAQGLSSQHAETSIDLTPGAAPEITLTLK